MKKYSIVLFVVLFFLLISPVYASQDSVELLSNQEYFNKVHEILSKAKESIYLNMYYVDYRRKEPQSKVSILIDDIVKAHNRGLLVKVILDQTVVFRGNRLLGRDYEIVGKNRRAFNYLKSKGVDVLLDTLEIYTHEKCVVVDDKVWLDDELIEVTLDWYAQDKDGNVWYMGEDSKEYEDGKVVSTAGSWEAGIDGAKPGIIMLAIPVVGVVYRQEYYKGEAEDKAEVLSLNESVTVPFGSYENCLRTKDWNPLDMETIEEKYYAPGVGVVLEVMVKGGDERVELISITTE